MGINYRHQKGAALFVSLAILLVLTILGISALRMTVTQNLIAGNQVAYSMAISDAKAAVSQAMGQGMLLPDHFVPVTVDAPIVLYVEKNQAQPKTSSAVYADARSTTSVKITVSRMDSSSDSTIATRFMDFSAKYQGLPGTVDYLAIEADSSVPAMNMNKVVVQEVLYPHL